MSSIIGNAAARAASEQLAKEIEERRDRQYDAGYRMVLRDDKLHTGSGNFIASHPVPRGIDAESRMREDKKIRARVEGRRRG